MTNKKQNIKDIFNLSGKVAVVTGGARGIGYGIVERLLEAGATVVISDILDKEGEEKADRHERASYFHSDISQEEDVKALIANTVAEFNGLDIFINNAGIFPSVPVMEMSVEVWQKIQDINLKGVFLCSKEAAKVMVGKGGTIINIASIDALHPSQVGLAGYDASKHGVWGFTKNFALEVASQNIRINAVAPGGISTEGVEEMTGGAIKTGSTSGVDIESFTTRIPMGRFGEPDDIAMPVLFLASDASRYMTGSILVVDGGYLLT